MKKLITTLATAGLIALGSMIGCGNYSSCPGIFRGYPAEAGIDEFGRKVIIYNKIGKGFVGGTDIDNDGNFDMIWAERLPKNHPLRAYENSDSLEVAYSELTGR